MKWTPMVAIVCITSLELVALWKGINGIALSLAVAGISGLGGYQIKKWRDIIKRVK